MDSQGLLASIIIIPLHLAFRIVYHAINVTSQTIASRMVHFLPYLHTEHLLLLMLLSRQSIGLFSGVGWGWSTIWYTISMVMAALIPQTFYDKDPWTIAAPFRHSMDKRLFQLALLHNLLAVNELLCWLLYGLGSHLNVLFILGLQVHLGSLLEDVDHNLCHGALKTTEFDSWVYANLVFFRWVTCPVFGRVPERYAVQHIYIHHRRNADQSDPETLVEYDRRSPFHHLLFVVHYYLYLLNPWDVLHRLPKNCNAGGWRLVCGYIYYCAVYVVGFQVWDWPGIVVLLTAHLHHASGAALDAWVWHALLGSTQHGTAAWIYASAVWVVDTSWCNADNHIEHHLHPGRHWTLLAVDELALNNYAANKANVIHLPLGHYYCDLLADPTLNKLVRCWSHGGGEAVAEDQRMSILQSRMGPRSRIDHLLAKTNVGRLFLSWGLRFLVGSSPQF